MSAAHGTTKCTHKPGYTRLPETLKVIVEISDKWHIKPPSQPPSKHYMRNIGRSNNEIRPKGFRFSQQLKRIARQGEQLHLIHRAGLPAQGARWSLVPPGTLLSPLIA